MHDFEQKRQKKAYQQGYIQIMVFQAMGKTKSVERTLGNSMLTTKEFFIDMEKLVRDASDDWRIIRVLNGNYPFQKKKWRMA